MNALITRAAPAGAPLTMSSREIAELCDKRHDHVLRDIEKMLQDIADPKFGVSDFLSSYTDSTGRTLKEYRLPKDLTVTLITGYRADLRYKVVKRLEELEQEKADGGFVIPRTLGDAQQLAADQARQIEGLRAVAAAHERLTSASGSLCITDAAKTLGVAPAALFDWLSHNGWIYKRPGASTWLGYGAKCDAGLLEHRTTIQTRSDGSETIRHQVRVTPKGLSLLAKIIQPVAKVTK